MPELAAHLERVASQVISDLLERHRVIDLHNETDRDDLRLFVAAALAACAREEGQWWWRNGGDFKAQTQRLAALERAVGEKAGQA